jgi:hypothetical protein
LSEHIDLYFEQRVNNDPTKDVRTLELKYGFRMKLVRVWWPNNSQNFMELRYLVASSKNATVLINPGGHVINQLRAMLINDNTDSADPEAEWEISNLTKRIA